MVGFRGEDVLGENVVAGVFAEDKPSGLMTIASLDGL